MNNVASALASRRFVASSRYRGIVYWATTVIIGWELLLGGAWDVMRIPYVYGMVVEDLGYPEYFLVILGAWKLLGAGDEGPRAFRMFTAAESRVSAPRPCALSTNGAHGSP